ncbi:MAG: CotH kinase family protein [Fibrobacterota bacterium]|nr:CotH kinase family protein [Chitinispirillaceae bacterium]
MNCRLLYAISLLFAGIVSLVNADSSSVIFDDTKIHRYDLQFYCTDWKDSLEYHKNLDEECIPARVVYHVSATDSLVYDSVGVRYKGNSSYAYASKSDKKPYKFSFDEYKSDQRFYGIKTLNFSNGAKDPTMMREKISYDIIRNYMKAPRAAFATISVDSEYIGLYTQVEQIDKLFLKENFKDKLGNLYKASDDGASMLYRGDTISGYSAEWEIKTNEDICDWTDLIGLTKKLSDSSGSDIVASVKNILNLDNICRYFAFNMVFSNFDSYTGSGRNFYLYHDSTDNIFTLIPWDLNLSFGAYSNSWNVITNDIINVANLKTRPLNRQIIQNDSLRQLYLGYIESMLNGPGSSEAVAALANKYKLLIDSLVSADSNKLHSYNDFVKNIDSDVSVVDGITRVTIPGLVSFCTKRAAALKTQLAQYVPVRRTLTNAVRSAQAITAVSFTGSKIMHLNYVLERNQYNVSIEITGINGQKILSVNDCSSESGKHQVSLNTGNIAPGMYMIRLLSGNTIIGKTSILVM